MFGYNPEHVATWTAREIWLRLDRTTLKQFVEDQRIERKRASIARNLSDVSEYHSMWSNTVEGGIIVFGVENDGTVTGCHNLSVEQINKLESLHTQMCPDAQPEIKRIPFQIDGQESFVISVYLPYRGILVETNKNEAYIRRGESKHKMSFEEKDDFRSSRHERSWEQRESFLNYPHDFDENIIQELCNNFRERENKPDWTNEEVLIDRLLLRQNAGKLVPLNALVLFAARIPRQAVPGCRIRVQRFNQETEGSGESWNPIKDFYIEGNIPSIISKADSEIPSIIHDVTWLNKDGKFVTTSEYPRWAWFEAIVNALVHRSYSFSGSEITVKLFTDRLEVESPGGFVPPVNAENVYTMRASRNTHLMDALRYLGFVRMTREGTRRMRESMEEWNLPAPSFSQETLNGVSVRVALRNDHEMRKRATDRDVAAYCGVDVWKSLAEHEIAIIGYAFNNGTVQVNEAAKLTGRQWNTSKKDLGRLSAKGLLEFNPGRFPRDPKAHYKTVDKRHKR